MKVIFYCAIFAIFPAFPSFAEKITFYTGMHAGGNPDYPVTVDPYLPVSFSLSRGNCYVSSIEKADGGVWKMRLTVVPEDGFPIDFDYFLRACLVTHNVL